MPKLKKKTNHFGRTRWAFERKSKKCSQASEYFREQSQRSLPQIHSHSTVTESGTKPKHQIHCLQLDTVSLPQRRGSELRNLSHGPKPQRCSAVPHTPVTWSPELDLLGSSATQRDIRTHMGRKETHSTSSSPSDRLWMPDKLPSPPPSAHGKREDSVPEHNCTINNSRDC